MLQQRVGLTVIIRWRSNNRKFRVRFTDIRIRFIRFREMFSLIHAVKRILSRTRNALYGQTGKRYLFYLLSF